MVPDRLESVAASMLLPATLRFDAAWVFAPGAILGVGLLVWQAWRLRRVGLARWETALLVLLRASALGLLVFLATRPVHVSKSAQDRAPYVSVLVDGSRSMSLNENGQTRYRRALDLLGGTIAPMLQRQGWKIRPLLFAEDARAVTADDLSRATPDGSRTDLGGALLAAMGQEATPPVAVVAFTDGVANETKNNARALAGLVAAGTPVIALGFGQDRGAASFSILNVGAPAVVPPKQEFRVSAQLEVDDATHLPGFDLLLLRDGQLAQTRHLDSIDGSRIWNETFNVKEASAAVHEYTVRAAVPEDAGLLVNNRSGTARVQISDEQEMRVLFVQGTLTWDYKFINKALRADLSVHLTGLSRTSDKSVYRQNVENEGELLGGFPSSLEQAAPFRVIAISNLKASDLTAAQQDVLTRFCGELGGGVLMLGGPGTFDASWRNSALEKLLPVVFDPNPGMTNLEKAFQIRLTPAALRHPIFQITDANLNAAAWAKLPPFLQYGRVAEAKAGATVWAEHADDLAPDGHKRILMATQHYGAGTSVVLCVENFWRWRLAKDGELLQFDRFWRQLFRYLGENSRETILIDFIDQQLTLPTTVKATVERQARAADYSPAAAPASRDKPGPYRVEVHGPSAPEPIYQADLPLEPGIPVPISFHADKPGAYRISVVDAHGTPAAERSLNLRSDEIEMLRTGRDMENLKQWASLTGGLARPAEAAGNLDDVVKVIHAGIDRVANSKEARVPLGLNGEMLVAVLTLLGAEWILRKRWNLN